MPNLWGKLMSLSKKKRQLRKAEDGRHETQPSPGKCTPNGYPTVSPKSYKLEHRG